MAPPFLTCSLLKVEEYGGLFLEGFMVQPWKCCTTLLPIFHWPEFIQMTNPNFKEDWKV
jgi:hypothetical protein